MAVSKEKFMALFLDEFRENLNLAENQIIVLKNDHDNTDALLMLLRTLHTIKGSSRMLQFSKIEHVIHGLESIFKGIRENRFILDAKLVRFFFMVLDRMRLAADNLEAGKQEAVADYELLLEACDRISSNETFDLAQVPALENSGTEATEHEVSVDDTSSQVESANDVLTGSDKVGAPPAEPDERNTTDATIRVDGETIDRSISLVNTLTIRQLRLRSGVAQIEAIEQSLTTSYRSVEDIKRLRKELIELSRKLRQFKSQYSDQLFEIEHGTQELRESVISMRMLPLSILLERFPRMVEEAAASLGKDVRLVIQGTTVRLDRMVLNKLFDPLIHLVRNAVDHGIEPVEERLQKGKPAMARSLSNAVPRVVEYLW
jgi:two-component system chemotaxis sensor kinase CheA